MDTNRRYLILGVAAVAVICLIGACAVLVYGLLNVARGGAATGEFAGYYTSGFEVSSFVPCGTPDPSGYGQGYWLGAAPGVPFYERYVQVVEAANPPLGEYATVFVRFRGRLSPPGQYGHLGAYSREITVTELLEMSLDGQCP